MSDFYRLVKIQWILHQDTKILCQENAPKYVVCKKPSILCTGCIFGILNIQVIIALDWKLEDFFGGKSTLFK